MLLISGFVAFPFIHLPTRRTTKGKMGVIKIAIKNTLIYPPILKPKKCAIKKIDDINEGKDNPEIHVFSYLSNLFSIIIEKAF